MGATLVERLVAEDTYPGAALICPVPPSGLLPVLTRLWWGRPDFFWHAQKLHRGAIDPVAMSTLREFYFTTNAAPEILAGAMRHLSPESPQAVMELAWRGLSGQADAHDTPMCVIAAGNDALSGRNNRWLLPGR
jgi:non-heme chloroperoxidase